MQALRLLLFPILRLILSNFVSLSLYLSMKTSLLLPLAMTLVIGSTSFAQIPEQITKQLPEDTSSLIETAREKAPEAIEEARARVAKAKTKSKVPDLSDPSAWGKEEVRKLAVMDVRIGKQTRTVMFELLTGDAPKTVANFIANVDSSLYNGLAVHRAIDGYLVQTGDPTTADDSNRDRWGTGGEDRLAAEIKRPHKLGAVAMARRNDKVNPERKSNDSQFYFVLGNLASLDGQYTVFGQVVSGLDVLEAISRVPADSNDCPLERVEIKSLQVIDHKGPLVVLKTRGEGERSVTKPFAAKDPFERFLERIW